MKVTMYTFSLLRHKFSRSFDNHLAIRYIKENTLKLFDKLCICYNNRNTTLQKVTLKSKLMNNV